MKIVIFGAGYVGTVTGACLAHYGHSVTFIEPNADKVMTIQDGRSPILEPQLDELIRDGVDRQLIQAREDLPQDLSDIDIAFVAVATPSEKSGSLNLSAMRAVFSSLSAAIKEHGSKLIVAIRSTIHPLALRSLMEEFRFTDHSRLSIVANPEFLRESTAVKDFFSPPFCIAGGDDPQAVDTVLSLYEKTSVKSIALDLETTCLLKYACNAFHALKIAFSNEISSLCESLQIDSTKLMKVFSQDAILNCSSAYLKPGFAFGGSCLPKDLRVLLSLSREMEEPLPLLNSILQSNQQRFHKWASEILHHDHAQIAVIGLSFKKNSDDLRESPFIDLVEFLLGKGIKIKVFDPDIDLDRIVGSNLSSIQRRPHHLFHYLVPNLDMVLEGCDGIILCKDYCPEAILQDWEAKGVPIYDLHYLRKRVEQPRNMVLSEA